MDDDPVDISYLKDKRPRIVIRIDEAVLYSERRKFLERWSALLGNGDPYFNPNSTDNELLRPDPDAFTLRLTKSPSGTPPWETVSTG
jgi:hypothetical protein